jgi:hypothetical protein
MNNYDNDDHIKNMENSSNILSKRESVLEFAGRNWWINYHWSQKVESMWANLSIPSSIQR